MANYTPVITYIPECNNHRLWIKQKNEGSGNWIKTVRCSQGDKKLEWTAMEWVSHFLSLFFFFVSLLPKETDVSQRVIQRAKAPVETHNLSELKNLKPECVRATTGIRHGKEIQIGENHLCKPCILYKLSSNLRLTLNYTCVEHIAKAQMRKSRMKLKFALVPKNQSFQPESNQVNYLLEQKISTLFKRT